MVSVLFARKDSIYKTLDCDVWDISRDARKFSGANPVVCHPPCRAWGQLSHWANPREGEKELAVFAVDMVRKNGGVLEHPANSKLWPHCDLPSPGQIDSFGGWTLSVPQFWFGHRAEKNTKLYICGVSPGQEPEIPFVLGEPSHALIPSKNSDKLYLPKTEREKTPELLARWLVELAGRIV